MTPAVFGFINCPQPLGLYVKGLYMKGLYMKASAVNTALRVFGKRTDPPVRYGDQVPND